MNEQARIETAADATIKNCELFRTQIAALEAGNESLRLVRDDYKRQADEYRVKWAALTAPPSPDAELVELLRDARCDLMAYIDAAYPPCMLNYPHNQRKHAADMEIVQRIDAKLASLKDKEGPCAE